MPYTLKQTDIDNLVSEDCTMLVNGGSVSVDFVIETGDTVEVTSNGAGTFTSTSVFFLGQNPNTGGSLYEYFTISGNDKVATLTYPSGYFYQFGVSVEVPQPDYIVDSADITALQNANATLKINGVLAVDGSEIFEGDALLAETLTGYAFYPDNVAFNVNSSIYFSGQDQIGAMFYLGFTLSEDNASATTTFTNHSSGRDYINLTVNTIQVTVVSGTNNVYLITSNKLSDINTERFVGTPPDVYDYGQFILNVLELPFSIDESNILEPENIMLATFETTIEAPKISTDKIVVDLGEITTPENEGNLLDFKNTTALLHLPRIEPLVIDIDYIVGQTISIQYIIDCYTGVATVNISSTKIDDVVITRQVDIGVNIPYAVEQGIATLYNSNVDVGGDNGVTIPFIEILKNEAILPYGFFTIPIIDEDVLSLQNGFIRVEEIELEIDGSYSEKQRVINALQGGVIIK